MSDISLKFHDTLHDETTKLTNITYGMEQLAKSFAMTGNDHMYDTMMFYANTISESADKIRKGYSEDLSRQVQDQQDAAAELFATVADVALNGGK